MHEFRTVLCPSCKSKLKFQAERQAVQCPKCNTHFSIASPLASLSQPPGDQPLHQASDAHAQEGRWPQSLIFAVAGCVIVGVLIGVVLLAPWSLDESSPVLKAKTSDPSSAKLDISLTEDEPEDIAELVAEETSLFGEKESTDEPLMNTVNATTTVVSGDESVGSATDKPPVPEQIDKKTEFEQIVDSVPKSFGYQWDVGDRHFYEFELGTETDDGVLRINGTCDYTVGSPVESVSEEELAATGTAFVVSSDGYLITCAHVVRDAKQIEVVLGNRQWKGHVVEVDEKQDLALVRIEASDLPVLSLGQADSVGLALSVYVVGYPLSDVLGSSVKMTSGTITGATDDLFGDLRRFQVDASVNPGNSGGPIVDERGQVVGVASELLADAKLTEVGFAVPIDEVRKLLRAAKVSPRSADDLEPKSGPDLAKMVTPSVALLKVTLDPAVRQSHHVEYEVDFHTNFKLRDNESKPIHKKEQGSFSVSKYGELSDYKGNLYSPFTFDKIGKLIVERLSGDDERSWTSTSITELELKKHQEPQGRFQRPRTLHVLGGDHLFAGSEPKTQTYTVIESSDYKIVGETDEQLTLEKSYESCTLDGDDPPRMQQQGSGTIVFSKGTCMPDTIDFKSSITLRQRDGSTKTVPSTLTYKRLDLGEVVQQRGGNMVADFARSMGYHMAKESERDFSNSRRSVKPKIKDDSPASPRHEEPSRKPTLARVAKLISLLEPSKNNPQASDYLSELAAMDVLPAKQKQVAEILMHYATRGGHFEQSSAIEGLVNWATKKQVPGMIKMLTQEAEGVNWPEKKKLITALGRFPSPKVYEAVASRLVDFTEEDEAAKVLIRFGSAAEEAVCRILESHAERARERAAEILRKIGTKKSLDELQQALVKETEWYVEDEITAAIRSISGN